MEAEPEKFRFESVTGVERRVAWNERNRETLVKEDARGGREGGWVGEGDGGERREAGWRLGGWSKGVGEGMSPELERWQSIDLVGFTVSFYLSLSFYISTRDSTIYSRTKRAHRLHCFDAVVFLAGGKGTLYFCEMNNPAWKLEDKETPALVAVTIIFKPRFHDSLPSRSVIYHFREELLIVLKKKEINTFP